LSFCGKQCDAYNGRGLHAYAARNPKSMLLKIVNELNLNAQPEEVWSLLRDTPRLAALLPGVESVTPTKDPGLEAYNAKAVDKIGPFKVLLDIEVRVTEAQPPSTLKASIKGADSLGLNRLTGAFAIRLTPALSATLMHFEADVEILGKLATLGAVPVRRRATDKFAEFARNIQAQFAQSPESKQPLKDHL
jgi:carbon monoxide dehydrogenase subunit G